MILLYAITRTVQTSLTVTLALSSAILLPFTIRQTIMTIKPATPQETFDHVFGSGATQYPWWLGTAAVGDFRMSDIDQPDNWQVEVTAENPDGNENVSKVVDHKLVMRAARKLSGRNTLHVPLEHECRNLVFDADACDLDAPLADCLLQIIVYGEVVFA